MDNEVLSILAIGSTIVAVVLIAGIVVTHIKRSSCCERGVELEMRTDVKPLDGNELNTTRLPFSAVFGKLFGK